MLYSKSHDQIYIGQTNNLSKRLEEHNSGVSFHTKKYAPWDLIFTEEYQTRSEAMKREKEVHEYTFNEELSGANKYFYRLKQIDLDGKFKYSEIVAVEFDPTRLKFELNQNYPNPFNPSTTIEYSLLANVIGEFSYC